MTEELDVREGFEKMLRTAKTVLINDIAFEENNYRREHLASLVSLIDRLEEINLIAFIHTRKEHE